MVKDIVLNVSKFVPEKDILRESSITFFHLKKTVAGGYRPLIETCGEHVLANKTCGRWFKHFKSCDFNVKGKESPDQSKKLKDADLRL